MNSPPSAVLLAGWADPAALFLGREAHESCAFWLDPGPRASRGWSMLGSGTPVRNAPRTVRIDPGADERTGGDLPPFRGGWLGWLEYESGAASHPSWMRVDTLLAFDHDRRQVWAIGDEQAVADAAVRLAAAVDARPEPDPAPARQARGRHTPAEYADRVRRCQEHIGAGTVRQLCLTTRFTVDGPVDPVQTYLRLRESTPAHHGGFVRIGERVLLSASPEQFLKVVDGRITTKPIKGTRPRGTDVETDAALARDLAESPKERDENLLITELTRRDLVAVCEPGSVRADALLQVESYPAVHQLVSTLSGRVRSGATTGSLWEATFPAGSMTGDPKEDAVGLLAELEDGPRGVYSGCFGWIGDDGDVDLAMIIRSIVVTGESAYVGSGGGITALSAVDAEVEEVATKARAPLAALGAEVPAGWAGRA